MRIGDCAFSLDHYRCSPTCIQRSRVVPKRTREIKFGKHVFRIVETVSGFQGIVVGNSSMRFSAGNEAEIIRKMIAHVMQADNSFVGYDGARDRFLGLFPGGLSDNRFIGERVGKDEEGELLYKRDMAAWIATEAPLSAALRGGIDGPTVLEAFQRMNLVDRFTKAKLSTVLKGPNGGNLVTILARFADGDTDWACKEILKEFSAEGVATWPVLTYLAFFWKPMSHAFLKPEFSKEYARQVGHRFAVDYVSRPEPHVYLQFLDMLEETRLHLSDLELTDYIDIHSFMWVVTTYDKPDAAEG